MIIVCCTVEGADKSSPNTDHWQVFEDMKDAQDFYQELVNQNSTWSASICGVIQSTDYEPYYDKKL